MTNMHENDPTLEPTDDSTTEDTVSDGALQDEIIPEELPGPSEADRLRDELNAERDSRLRALAEYDNFRKRSLKERENIYADVRTDTIKKFLPIFDDLERALKQETADEAYRRGVELILQKFIDVLHGLNVKEIATVGQPFDPALHDAVMHVEDEERGENEIVEELQKGFLLGDKVIRFSMVKVAN